MNIKRITLSPSPQRLSLLRVSLSALALAAASPAWAEAAPTRDSSGAPIRGSRGECVDTGGRSERSGACADQRPRSTWRILQNLIPQPYATWSESAPLPEAETIRFAPSAGFGLDKAGVTPELRDELLGFLESLERYRRVERVEVVGHADGNRRAAYAEWLGGKRAESVRAWLIARGVASVMIDGRAASEPNDALRGRFEVLVTVRGRR